ncbi:MAG: response regulator transcription factor [Flavisolibacter sp.]|nr:response regulator transcription factor [Flavisolibacter sp.]
MIKAILVDDEVHCLDTLSILLEKYCPQVHVLEKCRSAEEALKAIETLNPSLVFLDIEMPAMNGFEMLEQFAQVPFAVIFTTSYDQYAIKAIHISALDYLLKPIDPKELVTAVQKIQTQKHLPSAEQFRLLLDRLQNRETSFRKIAVSTVEGFELIPVEQIVRCEANDNYTYIFLKNNNKIIACRNLKEVEGQLLHFSFFLRVHHSYIVNLNEVTKYVRGEGGYVVMSDGSSVNVSRSRKEMLLKWFQ